MTEIVSDSVGAIPDDGALRERIRQRVEAAGTSFYWAMRLLPKDRRNGMYAVYAFCREVDDIADDMTPPEHKKAALAAWHAEIDALYAGHPRQLVARALREPVLRYALRREDFHAVIDGMEMDAAQDIRAPDLATLDLYCARVAERGRAICRCISLAIRAMRRMPSPTRSAARCSSPTSCAISTRMPSAAGSICRARSSIATASAAPSRARCCAIRRCPPSAATSPRLPSGISPRRIERWPAARAARCGRRAVMGAFYRATLDALLRSGWRDPQQRVSLSKARKLWLVLRHGLL